MSWQEAMRVTGLIEPVDGKDWHVERKIITEEEAKFGTLRAIMSFSDRGRFVPAGEYTGLFRKHGLAGRSIVMSDTPDEMRDHYEPYNLAQGSVLINGLGLGCLLKGVLSKPEVEHVDVVEISQELIDIISPYFPDPRVAFHCHDAFTMTWPKGTRWDMAWHDVWDDLDEDNLSDSEHAHPGTYASLNRKYGGRTGWQGAWGQKLLQSTRRESKRYSYY